MGRLACLLSLALSASGEDAREAQIVAGTAAAIEQLRKSEAMVAVVDRDGHPLAGVEVAVLEIQPDFRFGANLYMFDRCKTPEQACDYRDRFLQLFNYAVTDFYWKYYEPERGKPRYAHTDAIASWCAEHGIRLKGHPLFWQHTAGTVDWAKGADAADFERARIDDLLGRYRGRIKSWDVVNEPAHAPREVDGPFRRARAADPGAELMINDYEVFANGYPKYYELIAGMIARGVPLDAIGIQGHFPLNVRFPLADVIAVLDRYAKLGKPLHVTELTPPSGGQEILGSGVARGPWDEETQADYVEKLYRVLFAHPGVAAIGWWDLTDLESWQKGGGLLREDMSPKPAYDALCRLIDEEWRTALTATTDGRGMVRFRGFHGRYELKARGVKSEVQLRKGGLNAFRLVVDAGPGE